MVNNSAGEKEEIRKERQNFAQKLCEHTVNGQTNKHQKTELRISPK